MFPAGSMPSNMVLVDLNGDGALDYATVNEGANSVSVVFGHGDGTFETTALNYVVGTYPSGFTSGDFNGDGKVDLAVGWKYGMRVLVNQGHGTFANGPLHQFGYYNKGLVAGDFNHDGKLDLLATFATSADLKLLAGSGNADFLRVQDLPRWCADLRVGGWRLEPRLNPRRRHGGQQWQRDQDLVQ
jgi:hypothetical protein